MNSCRKHISLIRPVDVIVLLVMTTFAILLNGYREAVMHLPLVFKIADPSLLQGDLLSSFIEKGLHQLSFFFTAQAFLSRHVDIWTFNFIGYILLVFFLFVGVFLLAKQLFAQNSIAYLAVILLMVFKDGLAGGATFRIVFDYNNIATILTLFSLICFLRHRYIHCFILLGVSLNIHLLTTLPILGLYAYHLLVTRFHGINTRQRIQLFFGLGLFLIMIVPIMISNAGTSASFLGPPDPQLWTIMLARASHHYLPRTWMDVIVPYCPILILSLIAGAYFVQRKDYQDRKAEHRIIFSMLQVFFIYCLLEVIFTEFYPILIVMKLQLFRITTFTSIVGAIYIAYMMDATLRTPSQSFFVIARGYLFVSGTLIAFFGYYQYDHRLAYMMIPFGAIHLFPDNFTTARLKNWLFCLFLGATIYLAYQHWINQMHLLLTMIVFIFLVICHRKYGYDFLSKQPCKKNLVFASVLLWSVLVLRWVERPHMEDLSSIPNWRIPSIRRLSRELLRRVNVAHLAPMYDDYTQVQLWAHEHTEIDDIFIVPPFRGRFRIYSKRPVFVEFNSGGWYLLDIDLAKQWFERMNALGIYSQYDRDAYDQVTESAVQTLATKYNISYAVFKKPKQFNFPVAYENEHYVVYRLDKAECMIDN